MTWSRMLGAAFSVVAQEMGSLAKDVAEQLARDLGLTVMRHEVVEQVSSRMHVPTSLINRLREGKAGAIERLLARIGWSKDDVDLWEINEAFAVVSVANNRMLGLDPARVNVWGGAVALGHPIGASGARVLVTLLAALRDAGKRRGIASLCIGGGEGIALAVELL